MKARKNRPAAEPAATPNPSVVANAAPDPNRFPYTWLWLFVAAATLLGLIVYWPAVNGPFVFDDEYLPFRDESFLRTGVINMSPMARPMMNYTFWLNLRYFGEEPFSYHLVNILLHVLNTVLMFLAVWKLLEMAQVKEYRNLLATFAAGVFLLHPVNAESVAYVAGRSESFALPLFLGAYTIFLYGRDGGIIWKDSAIIIILFGAALFSKEHTAVLPGLLLLTDFFFPQGTFLETMKRNWRLYVPMVVVGAMGGAMVWSVLRGATTAGFGMKELPWNHYLYTQWRALWVYLRLFVAPVGLNADWDYPISRSVLDRGALFGLLGILALLGAAFYYRKRFPLALFGLLVFGLLIAPTSSVVPIRDALAERRMYLPFLGLLLILCEFLRHWKAENTIRWGTFGAVLILLAYLTYGRSAVWGDPLLLWQDAAEKNPMNSRAHFHLAMVHYERQECAEAAKKFEDVARLGKKEYSMLVDWGLALECAGQADPALAKFREAQALENTAHVRSLEGMIYAKQGKNGAALEELNAAEKIDANYDMTFIYRGNVYLGMNQFDLAESDYKRALVIKPDSAVARQAMELLNRRRSGSR